MISPAAYCLARFGEPGGLGDGQLDGCDAGRAGLAAAAGDGRVGEGYLQVSVANVVAGRRVRVVVVAEAGGGEIDAAVERAPDGGGPELGEDGQGGVPEGPGPAAGLALISSEHVLAGFEGLFHGPAASGDGDEAGHGHGPAVRSPAQAEGALVRAGDQAANDQVLPRDGSGGHRPAAVAGPLVPVPHERRPNRALASASSARIVSPDGRVTW